MTDLFSHAGSEALDKFTSAGMLCLFDFDGTLAPLVADPDHAVLPQATLLQLQQLQQLTTVGIVTGRSLADMQTRLGFEPDYVVGNHGLEGLPGWQQRAAEMDAICRGWRASLAAAVAGLDAGVELEDKRYTLSLHYRRAADRQQACDGLNRLFAQLSPPPRIIPGKCVFSLTPPHAGDKGQAVEQLISLATARCTLYVGDDVTDEDVFALSRHDVLSVRVGADPRSAAQFFIPDWESMPRLLDQLLSRLSAQAAAFSLSRKHHQS